MAYTLLERLRWSTLIPAIYVNIYYDLQRSGSSMQYKIKLDIEPLSGTAYFGYPIYQKISLDGAQKDSATLKNASPSEWSSSIIYESGWLTVTNKTSGTTALSVELYSGLGSTRSGTYSYSLPVSPAASVLGSVSSFNIGSSIPISITKYNSAFTDNLLISYGGTTVKTVSGITNGASISFSGAELNTIYGLMSTVKSGTFTFTLTTYDGGTSLGTSTRTATGTITDANPTLSASAVDVNAATIALTGNSVKLVKFKSTAQISITASGNKGATISSKVVNGTSVSGDSLTIENVSNAPFVITATDSRGNSTTVMLNPVVVAYVPLTVSANFYRPAPTTGEVTVKFSGNYFNGSFGAVANTLTLSWAYRLKGAVYWTAGGTFAAGTDYTLSGNTFTSETVSLGSGFDYQSNYEFILYFADQLVSANTGAVFVSKGVPVFDWGENGFDFHVPVKIDGLTENLPLFGGSGGLVHTKSDIDAVRALNVGNIFGGYTSYNALIPDSADLNAYTTVGVYRSTTGSTLATLSNRPTGATGAFWLRVTLGAYSASYRQEMVMEMSYAKYERYHNGSNWTEWKENYTSNNIIPISNGGHGGASIKSGLSNLTGNVHTSWLTATGSKYTKVATLTTGQWSVAACTLCFYQRNTRGVFGILEIGLYENSVMRFNFISKSSNLEAYLIRDSQYNFSLYIRIINSPSYTGSHFCHLAPYEGTVTLLNEQPLLDSLPATADATATNYVYVGSTANLPVFTGTDGLLETKSIVDAREALNIRFYSGTVTVPTTYNYVTVTMSGLTASWRATATRVGSTVPSTGVIPKSTLCGTNSCTVYFDAYGSPTSVTIAIHAWLP